MTRILVALILGILIALLTAAVIAVAAAYLFVLIDLIGHEVLSWHLVSRFG